MEAESDYIPLKTAPLFHVQKCLPQIWPQKGLWEVIGEEWALLQQTKGEHGKE